MKLVSRVALAALLLSLALPLDAADNAKQLYNKGHDAEARQDYEHAYDFFRQAFEKVPKDIKYRVAYERTRFLASASHVHRGQLLRDGGKLPEALAEFQRGLEIDPSSFIAQQELQRTQRMITDGSAAPAGPRTSDDMISRMVDRAAGPLAEIPTTTSLFSISWQNIPSHGRAGLLTRPNFRRSSSTGLSRSMGTIMLTCSALPSRSRSSCSDPMPINSPRLEISPVPPQLGCAGWVKIASSSRYSQ